VRTEIGQSHTNADTNKRAKTRPQWLAPVEPGQRRFEVVPYPHVTFSPVDLPPATTLGILLPMKVYVLKLNRTGRKKVKTSNIPRAAGTGCLHFLVKGEWSASGLLRVQA
jgi:hypothetical protein